jgi:hypothetical protein
LPTPAEVRRRRRGQRLAQLLTRYADILRPALLDLLAEEIAEIAAEVRRCH